MATEPRPPAGGSVRSSISLPAGLMARLARDGVGMNRSAICAAALEQALTERAHHPDVQAILFAAMAHGADEPDMETGDLQILFRIAYANLTTEGRAAFFADPEIVALLDTEDYAAVRPPVAG